MRKSSLHACIILLTFYQFTQAQTLSEREKNKSVTNSHVLEMYKESKTYVLNDVLYGDDFIFPTTLSYGHYKYSGNKLILTDSLTNQKLTYTIIDKFWLYPVKTFCYLSDVIWRHEVDSYETDAGSNESPIIFYATEMDSSILISNLLKMKLCSDKISVNKTENYLSDNIELIFYQDPCYFYVIFDGSRVLSSGKWKKKHSSLVIYDECLDRKFYFKIKNGIIGKNNFPATESKNKIEKVNN